MNKTEKRRRELLWKARYLYSDTQAPPAVHPRFTGAYDRLYKEEEKQGTFGVRAFLCFLLFVLFVTLDFRGSSVAEVNSDRVIRAVTEQADFTEILEGLTAL